MIFSTLILLSFHPVYKCFPNYLSTNRWEVQNACVFDWFYFRIMYRTCLASDHHYEVWQCDDLGIIATVNHLVMGSRWPSYALPTPGRQARQARTHDSVHDIVSDYTIWNVKFPHVNIHRQLGKSVEFQRRIISMYPSLCNPRYCPFHSK